MEDRVRSNRRRERGSGWLATLLGGALLMLLGFGLGVVVGVAWEEPAMVIGHVAGRGIEVPWAAAGPSEDDGEESAELPPLDVDQGELEEAPAGSPAPEAQPAPLAARRAEAPPPAAAEAPAAAGPGGFAVQVGAFSESPAAEALAERLRARGHSVYVAPGAGGAGTRWRVRVGPVGSREEAERLAAGLKQTESLPTWVIDDRRG